jgi:hypothetical protein
MSCILILNSFYKQNFEYNKPLFYDIPDKNGIMKHYRILYNADFMEIIPTSDVLPLTTNEIDLLIDILIISEMIDFEGKRLRFDLNFYK